MTTLTPKKSQYLARPEIEAGVQLVAIQRDTVAVPEGFCGGMFRPWDAQHHAYAREDIVSTALQEMAALAVVVDRRR